MAGVLCVFIQEEGLPQEAEGQGGDARQGQAEDHSGDEQRQSVLQPWVLRVNSLNSIRYRWCYLAHSGNASNRSTNYSSMVSK